MSGDLSIESGPQAFGLDKLAAAALTLNEASRNQIKEDAQDAIQRFFADEDNADQQFAAITRFSDDPVGIPYVVQPDFEVQGKGPFVPLLRGGRIVTVELTGPADPVNKVSLSANRATGQIENLYPGQPIDRLGEDGYALATTADSDLVKAIAQSFGHVFAARIDSLHQAMRAFGLAAPDLQYDPVGFIEAVPRGFKFSLKNKADGKETNVEIIRNGSIFLGGRRYDANLSRLALSDAEISNTGIFRIDVDHAEHSAEITFMTFDTKPARIGMHPSRPLEPEIEGKIPDSALSVLGNRSESLTLGGLARTAQKRIQDSKLLGGFLTKMLKSGSREAHADNEILTTYLAGDVSGKAEVAGWKSRPEQMAAVAEVVLRWLPEDRQGQGTSRISALVSIGVSKYLAQKLA